MARRDYYTSGRQVPENNLTLKITAADKIRGEKITDEDISSKME